MKCKKKYAEMWLTLDKIQDKAMQANAFVENGELLSSLVVTIVSLMEKVKVLTYQILGEDVDHGELHIAANPSADELRQQIRKIPDSVKELQQLVEFWGYQRGKPDFYGKAVLKKAICDLITQITVMQLKSEMYLSGERWKE